MNVCNIHNIYNIYEYILRGSCLERGRIHWQSWCGDQVWVNIWLGPHSIDIVLNLNQIFTFICISIYPPGTAPSVWANVEWLALLGSTWPIGSAVSHTLCFLWLFLQNKKLTSHILTFVSIEYESVDIFRSLQI